MTTPTRFLACLLEAGTVAMLLASCGKAPSGPPPLSSEPPKVGYVVVQPEAVAITTELPGRTSAFLSADVRPQVGGIIKARPFLEGSDVKAGELLYRIDPATYRASVDNAQATLDKAIATEQMSRTKADRYRQLAAIKAVSQQDFDDAGATNRQNVADVAASRALLETNRINLAYTRVTAPISGRIGRSSVTPGALVTSSQSTALATIQQLDPIYVDVTQSSVALLRLKRELAAGRLTQDVTSAKVRLVLEDGSTYGAEGTLKFTDVTVDQSSGTVTLRAVFPNPKAELLPGMYVRAIVEEGMRPQALLVPQLAVTRDGTGKATALIIDAQGNAQTRAVVTGQAIGDRWLVTAGLVPGDKVIVDGLQKAHPGVPVDGVPFKPAPIATASR